MNNIQIKTLDLTYGPAGRAVAQPMDTSLLDAFQQHLTLERVASANYFGISIWFLEREFKGFSHFFNHESQSEQLHASKFAKYLISRGQTVLLDQLPRPNQDWNSVEEVISYSFQMESDLTTSMQQMYAMAERTSDTRSNVFLDPIIDDQTSSEDSFAYLLGKVKFANNDPSALFIIDNELSQK